MPVVAAPFARTWPTFRPDAAFHPALRRCGARGAPRPAPPPVGHPQIWWRRRPITGWHRNWPSEFYGTCLLRQTSGGPCWEPWIGARRMASRPGATSRTPHPTSPARPAGVRVGQPGSAPGGWLLGTAQPVELRIPAPPWLGRWSPPAARLAAAPSICGEYPLSERKSVVWG